MFSRKKFLQKSAIAAGGIGLAAAGFPKFETLLPDALPLTKNGVGPAMDDEAYWDMIRLYFPRTGNFINLENGYFSPQASSTLLYHQNRENYINSSSSWFMRREQHDAFENARTNLAQFLGVDAEELAITRNTTESLNNIICGFPWKAGDEVIIGDQDYGSMTAAFHQIEKRMGIKVRVAKVPMHPKSDEEVITAYLSLVTNKTRLMHLTHLINLTGQVIPVAAIADLAHGLDIKVAVDAAHSVAQLEFKIPDLHADYVAASLHKWLCCPLGLGMLWMKKEHIPKIWPLLAPEGQADDNIRKFQQQGTRSIQSVEAITKAIAFHNSIGSAAKEARLKYLMHRWVSKVALLPKIQINTPWDEATRCSAIANVSVEGLSPAQLADKLINEFKIFTVAIDHPVVKGVRITPHLYNSPADVDALAAVLQKISAE
jgi:selenocysteine lyase/cysteine desulfurase